MNKRQRLSELSTKIFRHALEIWDSDKMSFAEARRQAARQVATVERLKPPRTKPVTSQPAPSIDSDASNARETLFKLIMGIRERMLGAETEKSELIRPEALGPSGSEQVRSSSLDPMPTQKNAPTPSLARRMIPRIKLKEDEPAAPSAPKPAPYSPIFGVYVGGAGRAVDLNAEFAGGPFRDNETTQNWRRSLADSKPRKPQNEIPPEVVVSPDLLAKFARRREQDDR